MDVTCNLEGGGDGEAVNCYVILGLNTHPFLTNDGSSNGFHTISLVSHLKFLLKCLIRSIASIEALTNH